MKPTLLIPASAVSLLAMLAMPLQSLAQEQPDTHHPHHYRVTDLGTLGGASATAFGISYSGRVAAQQT